MSLNRRLALLERKMDIRRRRQVEIEQIWQWRYEHWRASGWHNLPRPNPAVTLDEFRKIWRRAHAPKDRPSRHSRRSSKSDDTPAS
jgi:hypothetical protein